VTARKARKARKAKILRCMVSFVDVGRGVSVLMPNGQRFYLRSLKKIINFILIRKIAKCASLTTIELSLSLAMSFCRQSGDLHGP